MNRLLMLFALCLLWSCTPTASYDLVITNATIVDGSGSERYQGMVAVNADTIAYVGNQIDFEANEVIDAERKVVSPGFINMLSWAYNALLEDGRPLATSSKE